MTALSGTRDEWAQAKDGRWFRRDHPEDGIITLREGLSFDDYWEKRSNPPVPDADPRDLKIADLESRLAKLEAADLDRKALSLRD